MNRLIEFRGLCSKSKVFVYGDLIHGVGARSGQMYILPRTINLACVKHCDPIDGVMVIPETVGQFTGLHDKNGTKIFEGDVVKGVARTMQVTFRQDACQFWLIWEDHNGMKRYESLIATYGDDTDYFANDNIEAIGNIYEHPNLLQK